MANIDKTQEGLLGGFSDISKTLTDLMTNISGTIKGALDGILVKLGLKKENEISNQLDQTKLDLNKLKDDIKAQKDDIENINELSDKEKEILKNIIEKNKDIKDITDWIKNEFGEERQTIEFGDVLLNLKIETDGDEIEQSELDEIIKLMKGNKEKIEKDEILKNIIKNITQTKKEDKVTINKIIIAYDLIKKEKADNKDTIIINEADVLSKI